MDFLKFGQRHGSSIHKNDPDRDEPWNEIQKSSQQHGKFGVSKS